MNEDALENVIVDILKPLGWRHVHGYKDPLYGRLSLESPILLDVLYRQVRSINPQLPVDYPLERALPLESLLYLGDEALVSSNAKAFYALRDGLLLPVYTPEGEETSENFQIKLVDWDDIPRNDFVVFQQFTVRADDVKTRRGDLVLFINGLPIVFIELKSPAKKAPQGLGEMSALEQAAGDIEVYKRDHPSLFVWNQIVGISNGDHARVGTITSSNEEHYSHWRDSEINGVSVPSERTELSALTKELLVPRNLVEVINSYVFFTEGDLVSGDREIVEPQIAPLLKRMARPHQFRAVRKVLANVIQSAQKDPEPAGGKPGGVIWHTPGAGKSNEMLFAAREFLRCPELDGPTVLIFSDRVDLDDQFFSRTLEPATKYHYFRDMPQLSVKRAKSRQEADTLIKASTGNDIILVMIQKMSQNKDEAEVGVPLNALTERKNIIALVDEAHRSNYNLDEGGYAGAMRKKVPHCIFVAFTGTPIEETTRSTQAMFGPTLDHYSLTQSVADRVTVDVLYERREISVYVDEEAVDKASAEWHERYSDAADEEQVVKQISKELISHPERLAKLAEDICQHWELRKAERHQAKALIATPSKEVAAALLAEISRLRPDWISEDPLQGKIKVVYSHSPAKGEEESEVNKLGALSAKNNGLWRKRLRDVNDPLDIVIIVAMWLTGFDAPAVDTMYLLKPMRGATLIQSASRVNRYMRGKQDALVVDYCDLADEFREAIAQYGSDDQGSQYRSIATAAAKRYDEAIKRMRELIPSELRPEPARTLSDAEVLLLAPAICEHLEQDHLQYEQTISTSCTAGDLCAMCYYVFLGSRADGYRKSAGPKVSQDANGHILVMQVVEMLRQRIADAKHRATPVRDLIEVIKVNTQASVSFGDITQIEEDVSARTSTLEIAEEERKKRDVLLGLEPGTAEGGMEAEGPSEWRDLLEKALGNTATPSDTPKGVSPSINDPAHMPEKVGYTVPRALQYARFFTAAESAPDDVLFRAVAAAMAVFEEAHLTVVGVSEESDEDSSKRSWLEAGLAVLAQSGIPMTSAEIVAEVFRQGLRAPTEALTPEETLRVSFARAIERGDARVQNLRRDPRGKFYLTI